MRFLDKVPLFAGLPRADLDRLAALATTRTFPRRSHIVREGERSDALYVVLYGRLKCYVSDNAGDEVILGMIRAGDCFGEMALIDDTPRSASVMTLDATRLAIIAKDAFKQCLAARPEMALNLLKALNRRVRLLTGNVKSFALLDIAGRLARTLTELAVPHGDGFIVEQRVTHQELANMVGSSREMVTRALKDLVRHGYISIERRHIVVHPSMPRD
ncbi:MAG: Crp/Fnr family transcriptional regulator [Gammaproteobacteria bacterium]